ncbi:MAG: TspO/MBR family protein [Flavobacteriales bacterium]
MRYFALFLILNFAALAIGGLFTKDGVASIWYQSLHKAPWTPPGWVFGAAWTTIMVCFSVFMANAWCATDDRKKIGLRYALQWILNVSWNPLFFHQHAVLAGLGVITSLLVLVVALLWWYRKQSPLNWIWISPYAVWLVIATSLNAYIYWMN